MGETGDVRVISVDRPGLGASTGKPGRTFAGFAEDIGELIAARGLGRPAMVGNSQGAPFALACAASVSALALVSGADEVAAPGFELPPPVRDLVDRVIGDPAGAEEFFAGFSADAMWDMVIGNCGEHDLAVYREPGFAAAYRRAMDEAFAQGAAGYARDTVLAMGRWPFALEHIGIPVTIWYGEHDTSHSPDHGRLLASRIPGAVRHVVPGAGGSLMWTHTNEILRALTQR
ncbi:alpha/beta fold hydrolase [Kibdelosporangium phytohabitans]|uniref:alpha/beta fold hydrolase n=1 Tax=Kibdelosporangium phytohabitans TaxID=860235 RepID=UPI0019DCB1EB|nr:alpha/beta hydrolase [Kibdelosporangium phytohabitans]MBE1470122.1 pimeloyl-ACP methyl ester carboxylesterase [Kibdelosporangium phytohabitans]